MIYNDFTVNLKQFETKSELNIFILDYIQQNLKQKSHKMLSKYRQVVLLVLYFHLQVHGEPDPGPDAAHHGQYQAPPGACQNVCYQFHA